jgi:hypothetical protein
LGLLGVVACFREGDVGDTHASNDGSSSTTAATGSPTTDAASSDTTRGDPSVGTEVSTMDPSGASSSGSDDRGDSSSNGGTTVASDGSSSDTGVANECYACLMTKVDFCGCDRNCQKLGQCLYDGGELGLCCTDGPDGYSVSWNLFVDCALNQGCQNTCGGDPPDCI